MNGKNVLSCKKAGYKVYFLGAGGISMSALCLYLKRQGFSVSGYDKEKNDCVKRLEKEGIRIDSVENVAADSCEKLQRNAVSGGFYGENIPKGLVESDAVVYSSAICENDPLLVYSKKSEKAVFSRAELLAAIMKNYSFSIGISGTHGKTAATLMICHIFKCANLNFDAHVGGFDDFFGNFYFGSVGNDKKNDCFISEICEYKRNISLFSPSLAVVLNADNDHLESYGSFSALANEFINFARRAEFCVYNGDDKSLANKLAGEGVSFSIKNADCDYYAKNIRKCGDKIKFKIFEKKNFLGDFVINGVFKHNVLNALAATAVARIYKISAEAIYNGLKEYKGAYRREEKIGEYNGATVFADYCHHPKQIKETIAALEKSKAKNITIVFQPHTFSRTKLLFKSFLSALKTKRARLIITGAYAAREEYDYFGSGRRLAENVKNAEFFSDCSLAVTAAFSCAEKGDLIVFLGAGDIYFKAKDFLDKNKKAGL